jgi:hypothetical protein
VIFKQLHSRAALAVLAALILVAGCERPTRNQVALKAIKAESELLMKTHPIRPPETSVEVPSSLWPPAIAKRHPESVTVYEWGVEILTKPYFDGGWGYMIPRRKQDVPMPSSCYSEPGPGVYWHGPC